MFEDCNAFLRASAIRSVAHYRESERVGPDVPDEEVPSVAWYEDGLDGAFEIPCAFDGDFNGDGKIDRLSLGLQAESNLPRMIVTWSDGRRELVGHGPGGHFDAAEVGLTCSTSSWFLLREIHGDTLKLRAEVVSNLRSDEGPRLPVSHDGLLLRVENLDRDSEIDEGQAFWFKAGRWQTAKVADLAAHADSASLPGIAAGAPNCRASRRLRRKYFDERAANYYLEADGTQIESSPCELEGDFDGDGHPDRAMWGVDKARKNPLLFWEAGRSKGVQLVGESDGRILVAPAEPGCNLPVESWVDVLAVETLKLQDGVWHGSAGFSYPAAQEATAPVDAIAAHTSDDHVNIFFRLAGEWKTIAVPFDWDNRPTGWFWEGQLTGPFVRPPKEQRPYERPRRRWLSANRRFRIPPLPPGYYLGE